MVEILRSAFFEALGWSLIDSLWQSGVLWTAYCGTTANGKRFTSAARHNLALLAVAAGTVWFFISLFVNYFSMTNHAPGFGLSRLLHEDLTGSFYRLTYFTEAMPVLSGVYLLMIVFLSFRMWQQVRRNKRLCSDHLLPASDVVNTSLEWLHKNLRISRDINIWLSEKIDTPLTVGVFRPVILLPVAAVNRLSVSQVEAILAHELFHIQRNDYFLNVLVVFSEVMLFFNPFANLLISIVRKEREHSCDDKVLSLGFDAWQYSEALYILGRANAGGNPELLLAATGNSKKHLLHRVQRLLKIKESSPSLLKPLLSFFLCLLFAIVATRKHPGVAVPADTNRPQEQTGHVAPRELIMPPPLVAINKKPQTPPAEKKTKGPQRKVIVKMKNDHSAAEGEFEGSAEFTESAAPYFTIPVFVNEENVLEFTIIEPTMPKQPVIINREHPVPYVPGNTLFYPLDSLKTSRRQIIRI